MAKKITVETKKRLKVSNFKYICVGSLMTSLHVVFPLIKVLNKIGTVNLLTEDKAFLALSSDYLDDYCLGNVRVRIVDCVSTMEEEDCLLEDYDFTIFDVREFIPPLQMDKYIFLSARDFFRQQLVDPNFRSTPIYSVFNYAYHTQKEREAAKINSYVNEEFLKLGQYQMYDKMLYNLTVKRDFSVTVPSHLLMFIGQILEGYNDISKVHIARYLKEEVF